MAGSRSFTLLLAGSPCEHLVIENLKRCPSLRAHGRWASVRRGIHVSLIPRALLRMFPILNMNDEKQLGSTASLAIRPPLAAHANSASASLPQLTLKTEEKPLRRKSSFVRRLDSSEDIPSSHGSIVVAEYLSPFNSEASSYKTDNWDSIAQQISPPPEQPPVEPEVDENVPQRLSLGTTPIIYGHGTPLTTIIEQKSSNPTMRDSSSSTSATRSLVRPRSASDLSTSTTSGYARTPFPSNSPLRSKFSASGIIRRLESLSADDSLDSIKLSWPAGYIPTDGGPRSNSPIDQIYAQPLKPLQPPIQRPSTPPGMPSWTAAQQRPRPAQAPNQARRGWRLHEASSVLSRLFGNSDTSGQATGSPQTENITNPAYGIRGPWDGVPAQRRSVTPPVLRGAPRFRPPRSGHGPARLEMHPFARAQVFDSKLDTADTVSGSATAIAGPSVPVTEPSNQPQPVLRLKGKRKLGQRVRFTPSTADGGAELQRDTTATGADVQVCPHKRSASVQLQFINHEREERTSLPAAPAVQDPMLNDSTLVSSMSCQSLPLTTDHNTAHETAFASRSRCWRCRLDAASRKMGRAWDKSSRWCCWYCCGVDTNEILEDDAGSIRTATSNAPQVRSFEWERSRSR